MVRCRHTWRRYLRVLISSPTTGLATTAPELLGRCLQVQSMSSVWQYIHMHLCRLTGDDRVWMGPDQVAARVKSTSMINRQSG